MKSRQNSLARSPHSTCVAQQVEVRRAGAHPRHAALQGLAALGRDEGRDPRRRRRRPRSASAARAASRGGRRRRPRTAADSGHEHDDRVDDEGVHRKAEDVVEHVASRPVGSSGVGWRSRPVSCGSVVEAEETRREDRGDQSPREDDPERGQVQRARPRAPTAGRRRARPRAGRPATCDTPGGSSRAWHDDAADREEQHPHEVGDRQHGLGPQGAGEQEGQGHEGPRADDDEEHGIRDPGRLRPPPEASPSTAMTPICSTSTASVASTLAATRPPRPRGVTPR